MAVRATPQPPPDATAGGLVAGWRAHPVRVLAVLLVLVAAAVHGPHVADAGFIHDDWSIGAGHLHNDPGFLAGVVQAIRDGGYHPVGAASTAILYEALGRAEEPFLIWLAVQGVIASLLLYAVLRRLGVDPLLSTIAAVLLLVFPGSDAARLWIAGQGIQLSLILLLAGAYAGLWAVEAPGRRGAVRHLAATACFAAALTAYDAPLAAVAGMGLLYALHAPLRRAAAHGAADLATAAAFALSISSGAPKDIDASGGGVLERVGDIVPAALQLAVSLGGALGPVTGDVRIAWPLAWLLLALAVVAILVGLWRSRRPGAHPLLAQAVAMAIGGAVVVAAGTVILVFVVGYSPLGLGIYNRINVVAGVGHVLATVGVLATVVLLVGGAGRLRGDRALVAIACGAVAVGGMYVLRVRAHQDAYAASVAQQRAALDVLATLSPPAPGTTVLVSGVAEWGGPGVPVFSAWWDLRGALRITWDMDEIHAVPRGSVVALRCAPGGIEPVGMTYGGRPPIAYEDALFVDAATGRTRPAPSPRACERAAAAMGWPLEP